MARYFVRPTTAKSSVVRADWDYDDPLPMRDVYVPDHEAADTGLVDIRGDAIMRAPNPMGFGKDDEW
jgi:hypothetical protein